jgi:hypothetical protein
LLVFFFFFLLSCGKKYNSLFVKEQEQSKIFDNQEKEISPDENEEYPPVYLYPRTPELNGNRSYWIKGLGGMPILVFEPNFDKDGEDDIKYPPPPVYKK